MLQNYLFLLLLCACLCRQHAAAVSFLAFDVVVPMVQVELAVLHNLTFVT